MPDCVLVQNGIAWEIWRDTTKQSLCYVIHDGEIEARAIFPDSLIDAIVETDAPVNEGDSWNGSAFSGPPAPPSNPIIPGDVFLGRVEDAEYAAVTAAAASNPVIARWLELIRILGHVNVESDAAIAAKAGLISAGLLTTERADVIFAPL